MENVKDFWSRAQEILDLTLIDTAGVVLTVGQVLFALLALIGGLLVARIIERLVAGRMTSPDRFAIDEVFAEHEIVIAFPQRDLHVDGSLVLRRD